MTNKRLLITLGAFFVVEVVIIVSALYLLEKPISRQPVCQICAKTKAIDDYCGSCFDMDNLSDLFYEMDTPTRSVAL